VALVNPFGGHARIKGFVERQAGTLATELAGLVQEGYRVALLPNGTPWVTPAFLAAVEAHLPPAARAEVVIAPDPAETDPGRRVSLAERPDLSYADRVMRLFKYFAAYADLVCTVEGWLGHLAYDLGRPFRLVMMAQSHSFDWHPYGRSRAQELVTRLSPLGPQYENTEHLGEHRPPPLPGRPRKAMLELAQAGLGLAPSTESERLLLQTAASDDHDLRAAALAALGRVRPLERFKAEILAALRDSESLVRLRAAEALLDAGVDCRHELGTRADDLLRAHCAVARQHWERVLALGPVVLPVLAVAAADANVVIRREARWVARRILTPWAP
jgi:hypothetical protein